VRSSTGRGHNHIGRAVVTRHVGAQACRVEGTHSLRGAENRTANRLEGKCRFLQAVEHKIVGSILGRANFLYDHVLLAPQFLRIESWVGQDIGQNIEGERYVRPKHAREIARRFGACCGIEVPAYGFDRFSDLPRCASFGALESHVFEQVRNAVLVRLLVSAPGSDPHAEGRRFKMRHSISHH